MHISPVVHIAEKNNLRSVNSELQFGHGCCKDNGYDGKQRAVIAGCGIVGVIASMAILARTKNMRLFTKKFKDSYFVKADYASPVPIISMGAGSILGGLAGGYIVDGNEANRKSKRREALMQIGNVAIPIITVDLVADKIFKNSSKWVKAIAGIGGVFVGVALANIIMNKISNLVFHNKDERGVKLADYSAHVDDLVASASYISKSKPVYYLSRIIPLALIIPGQEVGNKKAGDNALERKDAMIRKMS